MARRGKGFGDWCSYHLSRPWIYKTVALVLFALGVFFTVLTVLAIGRDVNLMLGYVGVALAVFALALPYATNPGAADREYQAKHDALDAKKKGDPPPTQQLRTWARWLLYKQ